MERWSRAGVMQALGVHCRPSWWWPGTGPARGEVSNASMTGVLSRERGPPSLGSDTVKGTMMALTHRNKRTDRCSCLVRWALLIPCQWPVLSTNCYRLCFSHLLSHDNALSHTVLSLSICYFGFPNGIVKTLGKRGKINPSEDSWGRSRDGNWESENLLHGPSCPICPLNASSSARIGFSFYTWF